MSFITRVPGSFRRVAEAARLRVATQAEVEAALATDRLLTPENLPDAMILIAEQATTSGTSFDITTPIHANTRRITLMFEDISLSGTDDYLVQLGDAGGLETTGYVSTGAAVFNGGATQARSSTAGFLIATNAASDIITGTMTLTKMSGNKWISSHNCKLSTAASCHGGGAKTLSETLTQVTLLTTGANTFDNGSLGGMVE